MKSASLFLLLFFSFFVSLGQKDEELKVHKNWELKREDNGVKVFARWKEFSEEQYARQLRVEMDVDASPDAVVSVILDDEQADKWVKRVEEFYHFDFEGHFKWHTYSLIDLPWPLTDQDMVTSNKLLINEPDNIEINLEALPEYLEPKKGVNRIPFFEGNWIINKSKTSPNKLQVQYFVFTKPNNLLPRWIVDPIVENGLISTLEDMRELILVKEKEGVTLPYLH